MPVTGDCKLCIQNPDGTGFAGAGIGWGPTVNDIVTAVGEATINKGAANGYCALDGSGLVAIGNLPLDTIIARMPPGPGGPRGAPGSLWRSGASAPAPSLGVNGDLYLNTKTREVSQKIGGSYRTIVSLATRIPAKITPTLLHRVF